MSNHLAIALMFGITVSGLVVLYVEDKGWYRLNVSPSMPYGLWRVEATHEPRRGSIVVLCLPDGPLLRMILDRDYIKPGNCPSGAEPLQKYVAAVAGDHVSIDGDGIKVNGARLPDSEARVIDGAGRELTPLPAGDYRVPDGAYWAVVPYTWSFDSRYFGALPTDTIVGTAKPIITWERTP